MIMKRVSCLLADGLLAKTYLESGLNHEEVQDCISLLSKQKYLNEEMSSWQVDELGPKALANFFANEGAKLKHKAALKKFITACLLKVEYGWYPLKDIERCTRFSERLDTLKSIVPELSVKELTDLYVSISWKRDTCPQPKFDLLYRTYQGTLKRASFEEGMRAKRNGCEILGIYPFRDCDWAISLKESRSFEEKPYGEQSSQPSLQYFSTQISEDAWKNGGVDVKEINMALFILQAPILSGFYWMKGGWGDCFVISDNKCCVSVFHSGSSRLAKYRKLYYFREETPLEKEVRLMKEELERKRKAEVDRMYREECEAHDRLQRKGGCSFHIVDAGMREILSSPHFF